VADCQKKSNPIQQSIFWRAGRELEPHRASWRPRLPKQTNLGSPAPFRGINNTHTKIASPGVSPYFCTRIE
jgi:hypothetical protein